MKISYNNINKNRTQLKSDSIGFKNKIVNQKNQEIFTNR